MRRRRRALWRIWFESLVGPVCVLGALMLMAAITFTAHGGAAQDSIKPPAQFENAVLAVTDVAIAADQDQEVIASKEVDIATTVEQSIRHAALAPSHFQPPALTGA